jgi:hypothetical protein
MGIRNLNLESVKLGKGEIGLNNPLHTPHSLPLNPYLFGHLQLSSQKKISLNIKNIERKFPSVPFVAPHPIPQINPYGRFIFGRATTTLIFTHTLSDFIFLVVL